MHDYADVVNLHSVFVFCSAGRSCSCTRRTRGASPLSSCPSFLFRPEVVIFTIERANLACNTINLNRSPWVPQADNSDVNHCPEWPHQTIPSRRICPYPQTPAGTSEQCFKHNARKRPLSHYPSAALRRASRSDTPWGSSATIGNGSNSALMPILLGFAATR